ncbi:putative harbinger transposase-derived nuclease [Abeliophyllum distichum]|uniref:Harbinger transposase-derived nuclease n=1 Tax=Abeliophyllum distichum TaxID=126358 RepID=A0ABD1SCV9_9LAMI
MDARRRQRRCEIQCVGLFWTMVIQAIVIYDGIRRRARHLPRAPHRNWDMERDMTLTRMFGKYYLADAGFPLVPGFLSPYRRTRYHRRDIEGHRPENSKELFNFRHSSLRNAVERTIGLLKKRFTYLRHQPFHDISTQAKIVLTCCAIHNFLRIYDTEDVCENELDSSDDEVNPSHVDVPEEETPNAHISFTAEAVVN